MMAFTTVEENVMTTSRMLNFARSLVAVIALAIVPMIAVWAAPPPTQGVRATPIGNPAWKPVDFHLFSAPVGTAATGYAEFGQTALALLPPPNHVFHPNLLVGPGAPHQPPYDTELAEGVADLGFHEGVHFVSSEFSNGTGIYLVWMTVPASSAIGSSPDFAAGPIIPNSLFPIHLVGTSEHNGKLYSQPADNYVPALNASLDPPFFVDGHSHFPFFLADNADFSLTGAKLPGTFRWSITMTDVTGNGWHIEVHFTIGP
jgi:hypothetical protein